MCGVSICFTCFEPTAHDVRAKQQGPKTRPVSMSLLLTGLKTLLTDETSLYHHIEAKQKVNKRFFQKILVDTLQMIIDF